MTREVPVPLVRRLRELAAAEPERIAVTVGEHTISRGDLDRDSDDRARELIHLGVRPGDCVCLILPNGVEFVSTLISVWKTGATPVPLSARMGGTELDDLLDLIGPRAIVSERQEQAGGRAWVDASRPARPHPDVVLDPSVVSPLCKAIGSGGSTGRPKVIVAESPAAFADSSAGPLGIREGEVSVITAPLSHNGPFMSLMFSLMLGGRVVLAGRFDAEKTLALVEREKATWLYLVPTMMARIWKLPPEVRLRHDLSSLRTIIHMGAPCPAWLKRVWVDWLGPERFREMYASTEALVLIVATGLEWVERQGTVGRPYGEGEVQVRTPEDEVLPVGEVGRIWLRRGPGQSPGYHYLGATAKSDSDGWETLGDIGRLDEDGYLYIEDRESDMVLVGGSNVYPAEIEAVLLSHPAVADCCVIGLPDEDLGQAPHALVYALEPVGEDELAAFVLDHLAPYKRPRSYEFVDHALRDPAGKVRRRQLVAERVNGSETTS